MILEQANRTHDNLTIVHDVISVLRARFLFVQRRRKKRTHTSSYKVESVRVSFMTEFPMVMMIILAWIQRTEKNALPGTKSFA